MTVSKLETFVYNDAFMNFDWAIKINLNQFQKT